MGYEIQRHTETLNSGEKIVQETRLWDEKKAKTFSMRGKEEAKDYRYFPEPDLPPVILKKEQINAIKEALPELPREKKIRFIQDYGLTEYDAGILTVTKQNALYAEERLKIYPGNNKKPVANWLIGPLASTASNLKLEICNIQISPKDLTDLIDLVENKKVISHLTGKAVLEKMAQTGKSAEAIIQEENLAQISDENSLEKEVDVVILENPKVIEDIKAGKVNSIMFLVGQAMKKTKGRANPKTLQEIIRRRVI